MREAITPFLVEAVVGGDEARVRVAGELDMETAPRLRQCLAEVAARRPSSVCLDLRDLQFIDSTGLSLLVAAARQLPDGALRVTELRPPVRRVFELTGVDSLLPVG